MGRITDNIKAILAIFVTVSSICYFFTVTVFNVKPDPQIIIAMVSINTSVLSYYFGSSQGQSKKDEIISNMTK